MISILVAWGVLLSTISWAGALAVLCAVPHLFWLKQSLERVALEEQGEFWRAEMDRAMERIHDAVIEGDYEAMKLAQQQHETARAHWREEYVHPMIESYR